MWTECPYKHKLVYIDKLPHFAGNEFTAFGSAIHKACEEVIKNKEISPISVFKSSFEEEIETLKATDLDINYSLLEEMRKQAENICNNFINEVEDFFGPFEVFSVEEELFQDIEEFTSYDRKFKGFIDAVLKTSDGKFHIIDWKTCSWGWNTQRKNDKITNYQLTLYKHYFSKKHKVNPNLIETYFGLLKRTASKNNVEILRVSSGQKKTNNCLTLLERSVINIERRVSFKT